MGPLDRCADCGKDLPDARTDHSLISELGWRLERKQRPDETWTLSWHCPECWKELKRRKLEAGEPPPSSGPPTGRGGQRT